MLLAYSRISTNKETQKHDRQLKAINDYAKENGFIVDRYFSDIITGKTKAETRPQYQQLKQLIRAGDILIVSDLDRIGRDADNVISELKNLQGNGVKVIALDIPYMNDFKHVSDDSMYSMVVDILITLKAHIAQQELEKTRNRIIQGLQATDKKLGRPKLKELPPEFVREYVKFKNGEYGKMTATTLARVLGIGRSTLYKYIGVYEGKSLRKLK